MCGRCACTRGPRGVARACAYRNRKDVVVEPSWVLNSDKGYWPSYNVCPQSYTPVLISGAHSHVVKCGYDKNERVLQSMKWGLVPAWHKGDPDKFSTLLNNCRSETMQTKPSFRGAISKGQRCVVLADGFYEWQTAKPGKQPYFITFADDAPTKEAMQLHTDDDDFDDATKSSPCKGRLLTMAGYFDIWRPANGHGEELFTYTIVTVEAKAPFSDLHHRMPAILDGDDAIKQWLDFEHVPMEKAIELVHPVDCLKWYPVSTAVNNSRNKSPDCMKEVDPSKPVEKKLPPSQPSLFKWMTKSPHKKKHDTSNGSDSGVPPAKKEKQ